MTKNGNNAEKTAAHRVQNVLQLPYTHALRMLREAKTPELNWGRTADLVIERQAGPGIFDMEGQQ